MSSKSLALVFSGQGAHRKGMCMSLVNEQVSEVIKVWNRCTECCRRNFGFSLHELLQENPVRVRINQEALVPSSVNKRSCHDIENMPESSERSRIFISHPLGVMHFTFLTQPCMATAHLVALEYIKAKDPRYLERFSFIAGHSLGEYSALAALGVFPPEVVIDLTFKRGLLMESYLGRTTPVDSTKNISASRSRAKYRLYACNPLKAGLDNDPVVADDIFFCLVELISRTLCHTTSSVEVVNLNILHKQYVVAGDSVGLSVLGKCLDPFFREQRGPDVLGDLAYLVRSAVVSVTQDIRDGVSSHPNDNQTVDFVSSSSRRYGSRHTFHRFIRGPDDGYTPSLDSLTQLTLEEEGRSGLKRKTWFIPVSNIEVPFHSSHLRQPMDDFLPVVLSALPEEKVLRELLSVTSPVRRSTSLRSLPLWVTNLTGKTFAPFEKDFQQDVEEAITSFNIGEVRHVGRYDGGKEILRLFKKGAQRECVRDMCAAVLAGQLAHPVMWIDSMEEMVVKHGVTEVHEISPVRALTDMFKRNYFSCDHTTSNENEDGKGSREKLKTSFPSLFEPITAKCFPADKIFFHNS